MELAKIKSVQLEFVKHSLLSRKVISIEKKIENIQVLYSPRLLRVKKIFRVLRVRNEDTTHNPFDWLNSNFMSWPTSWFSLQVLAYSGIGLYLGNRSIVLISPQLLWPISWFTNRVTMSPYALFIIFIFGGTFRHVLRTLLPLIFTRTTFPWWFSMLHCWLQ